MVDSKARKIDQSSHINISMQTIKTCQFINILKIPIEIES